MEMVSQMNSVIAPYQTKAEGLPRGVKPAGEKKSDLVIHGLYNKKPLHISVYVLSSEKVLMGSDLCKKRHRFTRDDLLNWCARKAFFVFRGKYVKIDLCGYEVNLTTSDIRGLLSLMNQHKED